jgi:uncharacterized protein (TIGR03435 family)
MDMSPRRPRPASWCSDDESVVIMGRWGLGAGLCTPGDKARVLRLRYATLRSTMFRRCVQETSVIIKRAGWKMGARWWGLGLLPLASLWAAGALAQGVPPMAKDATPVFEVAAIKLTAPGDQSQGFQTRGTHVLLKRQTVGSMIMFAYGVHRRQIVDGPAWLFEDAYDVDGVPDVGGEPDVKQMQAMVRGLLADRFGVKLREEKRDLGYYGLRVANGGPKLTRSAQQDGVADDDGSFGGGQLTKRFRNNSMTSLTLNMQYFTDRPVVNETGLEGEYDFALRWAPDDLKVGDASGAPGLFTALKEQLGLKLEPAKGPVTVMVVETVARPSEN